MACFFCFFLCVQPGSQHIPPLPFWSGSILSFFPCSTFWLHGKAMCSSSGFLFFENLFLVKLNLRSPRSLLVWLVTVYQSRCSVIDPPHPVRNGSVLATKGCHCVCLCDYRGSEPILDAQHISNGMRGCLFSCFSFLPSIIYFSLSLQPSCIIVHNRCALGFVFYLFVHSVFLAMIPMRLNPSIFLQS